MLLLLVPFANCVSLAANRGAASGAARAALRAYLALLLTDYAYPMLLLLTARQAVQLNVPSTAAT